MDWNNLTWTCHICKEERPDHLIGVMKHPLIINGQEFGEQNVRYCLDRLACAEGAIHFRFVEDTDDNGSDDSGADASAS